MFLQILRPLEGLSAEVAFVWFQGYVNTDMRGDVVALDGGRATGTPLAGEVEVVCALAPDMALADMILEYVLVCISALRFTWLSSSIDVCTHIECFCSIGSLAAALPLTGQVVDRAALRALHWLHRR